MGKFREIRRKDRILDDEAARELLRQGEYGFLGMCSPEGYGYGIPLSFVYRREGDGTEAIYFHSAPEGHKLDAVAANPRVSFCVVGDTEVMPYTTAYESVHVFGRIAEVERGSDEFLESLRELRAKYNPELANDSDTPILKSVPRTTVLKLTVEHLSGKCKRK